MVLISQDSYPIHKIMSLKERFYTLFLSMAALFLLAGGSPKHEHRDLILKGEPAITVFKNINLFDGTTMRSSSTVIITDSVITDVGVNLKIPRGARVINGEGYTLLPGLIDAHVHMFSRRDLCQEAVFGITTVLDMMTTVGFMNQTRSWIKREDNKNITGYFSSGQPATYPRGHGTEWGTEIPVMTKPEDVSAFIDASVTSGSDYIKIMSGEGKKVISKEVIKELSREAKKRNLLTLVHIQTYKKALEAIEAEVNGLAHCFADTLPGEELLQLMKRNKSFVIPTLTVMSGLPDARKIDITADTRFTRYLTPELILSLRSEVPYAGSRKLKYTYAEETVRILHHNGIPILAGSDSYNPGTSHGASLHCELELLTYAGLTPIEVLASATSLTAKVFGLDDRGVIAPGKRADLLLVRGNPCEVITDTRNIEDVWIKGHLVDRERWIGEVKAQNDEWEKTGIIPPPPGSESGLICNFDSYDYSPSFGFCFFAMSDKFMGGYSESSIKLSGSGVNGSNGALSVSGTINNSFPGAWAGAAFFPGASESSIVNLSGWNALTFHVKGDVDSCMVMFLLSDQKMPVSRTYPIQENWQTITVPFFDLGSSDGMNILGMIWGTKSLSDEFNIQFDEIELKK